MEPKPDDNQSVNRFRFGVDADSLLLWGQMGVNPCRPVQHLLEKQQLRTSGCYGCKVQLSSDLRPRTSAKTASCDLTRNSNYRLSVLWNNPCTGRFQYLTERTPAPERFHQHNFIWHLIMSSQKNWDIHHLSQQHWTFFSPVSVLCCVFFNMSKCRVNFNICFYLFCLMCY